MKTWKEEMEEKLAAARTSFVAWDTSFGQVFAGRIKEVGYDTATIKRVDGGICATKLASLRPASVDDITKAFKVLCGVNIFH